MSALLIKIYYINPAGMTESVICQGETQEELQKDADLTIDRLGWNRDYCWSEVVRNNKGKESSRCM